MTITVKFFAALRERMGVAETEIALPGNATVDGVWRALNNDAPFSGGVLAAVNHDYATPEAAVHDGDEVAFFPPVTGG